MKIRIESAALAASLKRVIGASNARADKSYLANVLLEAEDDTLRISTTDLDISAREHLTCEVLDEGSTSTPVKALREITNQMTEDEVEFEVDQGRLGIRAGSVSCRLMTEDVDHFPQMFFDADGGVGLEAEEFVRLLTHAGYCPATDGDRPGCAGVHFVRTAHDRLTVQATDGHRAVRLVGTLDAWDHENEGFLSDGVTLPVRGVRVLDGLLDKKGAPVDIAMHKGQVVIAQGAAMVSMRPVAASFPELGDVLPDIATWRSAHVDKDVLQHALRLSRLFVPKSNSLRLAFSEDGLELYATNPDVGESKQVVPCEWSGEETKIKLNWRFLDEALGHVSSNDVAIWLDDDEPGIKPVVILDTEDEDAIHIVMPMRL